MSELNLVLRSLSTGRAPGPDSIPADIIKGAPCVLKLLLLDHFNHYLLTSTVSDSWSLSEVVMLVKKIQHDTRDLSNYCPIFLDQHIKCSLLLFKKDLPIFSTPRIRSTQFGFALNVPLTNRFILCVESWKSSRGNRILSMFFFLFGPKPSTLSLSLLSNPLSVSLVFPLCSLTLFFLYTLLRNSEFVMQVEPHMSFQTRGLRQGCPLSPYLFNFVLSHLFHDVESSYVSQFGFLSGVINTPSPLWDLEYADNTALLSNSAEQITRLLHLLQREAFVASLSTSTSVPISVCILPKEFSFLPP